MTDQQTPPNGAESADVFGFLDDDSFTTPPIPSMAHPEGRAYTIHPPVAKTGMELTALAELVAKRQAGVKISEADVARLNLNDEQERVHHRQTLGAAFDEMVADGVSWTRITKLSGYAFACWTVGKAQADHAARQGAFSGGAVASPNRAQRRAQTSGQSDRQGSTGSSPTRRRRRR